jgi:hypothetical protein
VGHFKIITFWYGGYKVTKSSLNWLLGRSIVMDNEDLYVLTFTSSEDDEPVPVTQVLWISNERISNFMIPWEAKDLGFSKFPEPHFVFVGPRGEVMVYTQSGHAEEFIDQSIQGPIGLGAIREVRRIDSHFYVVGMGRQVYIRETGAGPLENANWKRKDLGVVVASPNNEILGFNSIDGFSENDIYAVGWQGEIWHSDGEHWIQLSSPTNVKLEKVICGEDGYVYAVGQSGTLLKGNMENWEVVNHDVTADQFWGAAWYRSRLWLSTSKALYSLLEGNLLEEVDFKLGESISCNHLAASSEVLWSIGPNHLVKTNDGISWSQVFIETESN